MAPVLEPWCSEPVDLEALVDTYVVVPEHLVQRYISYMRRLGLVS